MKNMKLAAVVLSGICAVGMVGCKNEVKDAGWYLRHGDELQKKLAACKADPETAKGDAECDAATDAFLQWYAASGQAGQQAAAPADTTLTAPAAPDAATTPPAAVPDSSADPQSADPQDAGSEPPAPAQADQQN